MQGAVDDAQRFREEVLKERPITVEEDAGWCGERCQGAVAWLAGKGGAILEWSKENTTRAGSVAAGLWRDLFSSGVTQEEDPAKAHRDAQTVAFSSPDEQRILHHTRLTFSGAKNESAELARESGEIAYQLAEAEGAGRGFGMAVGVVGKIATAARRAPGVLGREGEMLVMRQLEARNYTIIGSIQNPSGHGIDIVARTARGELRFIEVKTTETLRRGRLSDAQRYTDSFIRTRLEQAAAGDGQWKGADPNVRKEAARLLKQIEGKRVLGVKADVRFPTPGKEGPPSISFSLWRDPPKP